MKIVIFGATGKTGVQVILQALEHGHQVTVMVRDPKRLPATSQPINILTGDLNDHDIVKSAIKGQDAVICTLGARELYKNSGVRTIGTRAIIKSMEEVNVKRLVVMSSMGIGESWNTIPMFTKLLFKLFMPAARKDHEAQELVIKTSSLDWTIIRPSGLTDDPLVSNYDYGKELVAKTSKISRANVADLILKVIELDIHIHDALTISN
jgi:putative NADH-flavin reductase